MNRIKEEHELSLKYDLTYTYIDDEKVVELSKENVAKIESILRYDSSYRNAFNPKSDGSSAFYIKKFKEEFIVNKKDYKNESFKNLLSKIINTIDSENSTHLNSDLVGREELLNRLLELNFETLYEYLKYPLESSYELIKILSKPTHPKDNKHKGRRNFSFATKFCHYMCFNLFDDDKQDNFPIFDNVINKAIKERFHKKFDGRYENYDAYVKIIDEIIKENGNEISRNGFDHLVWYVYKGAKRNKMGNEVKEVSYQKIMEEIMNLIEKVTVSCGRPLKRDIDFYLEIQNKRRKTDKKLPTDKIAIYTFFYKDLSLKIGQVGKNSNVRFQSQHYNPKSAISNLAKSILTDQNLPFKLNENNVKGWLKNNTTRIDVIISSTNSKHRDKFILNLLEGILQYKYQPRYEH